IYDDQWRPIATYRENLDSQSACYPRDCSPKEEFVYHNAGLAEPGASSSYLDLVILRDRDNNTAWSSASDGTLEDRIFYCQSHHADVVVIVDASSHIRESDRYGEYGAQFGMPAGDTDAD